MDSRVGRDVGSLGMRNIVREHEHRRGLPG